MNGEVLLVVWIYYISPTIGIVVVPCRARHGVAPVCCQLIRNGKLRRIAYIRRQNKTGLDFLSWVSPHLPNYLPKGCNLYRRPAQ